MITLEQVSVKRENRTVLSELSLTVAAGEVIVLCGASGSGKSTLLNVLNGLIPELYPAEVQGKIRVGETDLPVADFSHYAQTIGVVFQNPKTQFFTTDVYSELAFSMENAGVAPENIRQRITEVAQQFSLTPLLDASVFDLSGGEKQLIALAAATMLPHDVFLLDEPSSNLDQEAIQKLTQGLASLKQQGKTIVIAEHRLAYLAPLADRFCLLEAGRLRASYPAAQLLSLSEEAIHELGLRKVGEAALETQHCRESLPEKSGLTATHLQIQQSKRSANSRNWALNLSELQLPMKQAVGIVGPNGAGKSTLVQVLCGLKKCPEAVFAINGQKRTQKQLLQESFLVMQDVNLQLFFETVEKELLIKAQNPARFEEIVSLLHLTPLLARHPQSLSGGEKQRVAIGSALLSGKRLLFFDEPTSGLDLQQMEEVAKLLRTVAKEVDLLAVISHDREFLAETCPYVLQLEKGELVGTYQLAKNME